VFSSLVFFFLCYFLQVVASILVIITVTPTHRNLGHLPTCLLVHHIPIYLLVCRDVYVVTYGVVRM
jgi:hypothetical protein